MRKILTRLALTAGVLAVPALAFAATHKDQIACICGPWCPWKH